MIASGGEVNILDSVALELTDDAVVNAIQELKTFVNEQAESGDVDAGDIVREAR